MEHIDFGEFVLSFCEGSVKLIWTPFVENKRIISTNIYKF